MSWACVCICTYLAWDGLPFKIYKSTWCVHKWNVAAGSCCIVITHSLCAEHMFHSSLSLSALSELLCYARATNQAGARFQRVRVSEFVSGRGLFWIMISRRIASSLSPMRERISSTLCTKVAAGDKQTRAIGINFKRRRTMHAFPFLTSEES